MNKSSDLYSSFSYSLIVGALNFVLPYSAVISLLVYILATEVDPFYWQLLTAVMIFVPAFWVIDSLFNSWSKVVMYISVLIILISVIVFFPEFAEWEKRQVVLYIGTFAASRALLAYVSLSTVPQYKAFAELVNISTHILWMIGGYLILSSEVDSGPVALGFGWPTVYLFVNFISVFMSSALTAVALIWRNAKLTNVVEKLRLISTWSFDEEVVHNAVKSETSIQLKPSTRAVMFGDIRGFTAYTEQFSAEKVVEVLNEMYHIVDKIVLKYGGAKPEFIADEFITYFNKPQTAVDCGVELIKAVNTELVKYDLGFGIGIDYGNILEGILGSKTSKKYTVIGTHVNTAARLQAKAKTGEILISSDVRNKTEGYKVRLKPNMKLKGVSSSLRVYELKYTQRVHKITVNKVNPILKFYRGFTTKLLS